MTAPVWMNAVIGDFGRAAGLNGLALNERGTAVLIRTGLLPKTHEGVMAVRLAERDVTLPRVSGAFELLWRLAREIGGAAWA